MRLGWAAVWCGLTMAASGVVGRAQTVELRIVEREGQGFMPWPPQGTVLLDGRLNFAVQARVVGGQQQGIRAVTFQIVAWCEQESWGSMSPLLVSREDGSYDSNLNQGVNSRVLQGGLAAQFCGIAVDDPTAEGFVNVSGPGFVHNPSAQEIGMIRAVAAGKPLLRVLDLDRDGIPDTSALNGTGPMAPVGSVATLDVALGAMFFGAAGNWVDVYRFRYNKTGFGGCPATVTFRVEPVGPASVFSEVERGAGPEWIAREVAAAGVRGGSVTIVLCSGGAPCSADHDGSETVEVQDIFQYISDWFNGCGGAGGPGCGPRSADFDCNGTITIDDLFAFIGGGFRGADVAEG